MPAKTTSKNATKTTKTTKTTKAKKVVKKETLPTPTPTPNPTPTPTPIPEAPVQAEPPVVSDTPYLGEFTAVISELDNKIPEPKNNLGNLYIELNKKSGQYRYRQRLRISKQL